MRAFPRSVFVLAVALLWPSTAWSQAEKTAFPDPAAELSYADSLSIFHLIDSLLTLENRHQLSLRLSYNSNMLAAGRTLGIEQFGLVPGVSYLHPSGAFADVSTYWSNRHEPPFYLTTLSAGYVHLISPKLSVMGGYNHYWYQQPEEGSYVPYRHSVNVTPLFDLKPFSFQLDYSFYFGDDVAHRIMPGVTFNLIRKRWWVFDRLSVYPSAYLLLGDLSVTRVDLVKPRSVREALENFARYGSRWGIAVTENHLFGVMNYAFGLPVNMSRDRWMFNVTYTYNIPRALDGESLTISNSGFLSASVAYTIDL